MGRTLTRLLVVSGGCIMLLAACGGSADTGSPGHTTSGVGAASTTLVPVSPGVPGTPGPGAGPAPAPVPPGQRPGGS